jgi:hypothetical protein
LAEASAGFGQTGGFANGAWGPPRFFSKEGCLTVLSLDRPGVKGWSGYAEESEVEGIGTGQVEQWLIFVQDLDVRDRLEQRVQPYRSLPAVGAFEDAYLSVAAEE